VIALHAEQISVARAAKLPLNAQGHLRDFCSPLRSHAPFSTAH